MKRGLLVALLLLSTPLYAGLEEELQKVFSSVNANITEGGAFQGQQGGYYTGGGAYLRMPTRTVSPINFQLPSVDLGCNGLNAYMGSFSVTIQPSMKKISHILLLG